MKRRLDRLATGTYDLLIIGGGIYGAWAAWDAALRGLSVALIDGADFGGATSANSQKIAHGGLRYLQTLDVMRMRESIRERRALLRLAPHLVRPMPCLMPTYGWGRYSRAAMRAAMGLNDLISLDRNRRLTDPAQRIPMGRLISRTECLQWAPDLHTAGLTGAAVWHDAQIYNTERLTLSVVLTAAAAGAALANYVRATGFLMDGTAVRGVRAEDALTGSAFEIRARVVLNTSGPWVDRTLAALNGRRRADRVPQVPLVKAVNLLTRPIGPPDAALAVASRTPSRNTPGLLFITPWRGRSIIGSTYAPFEGDPAQLAVSEAEVTEFLDDINRALPKAHLRREDVVFAHVGLLPGVPGQLPEGRPARFAKRYRLIDHQASDGVDGLLSVIGVKYTTARDVAEKAVDRVFDKLSRPRPVSRSARAPLADGQMPRLDAFLAEALRARPSWVSEAVIRHLALTYGTMYPDVLHWAKEDGGLAGRLTGTDVLRAEVAHAVQEEMAIRLADVVFRRTELGSAGPVEPPALAECSAIMAEELGWDESRRRQEIEEVWDVFRRRGWQGAKLPSSAATG